MMRVRFFEGWSDLVGWRVLAVSYFGKRSFLISITPNRPEHPWVGKLIEDPLPSGDVQFRSWIKTPFGVSIMYMGIVSLGEDSQRGAG